MPKRPRVVVGEDDESTRGFYRSVLAEQGYDVDEAEDGDEVLRVLRKDEPPALLVLDIAMPARTGWGVVAEMGRDPEIAGVPVLLVTGHEDEDFRRRAEELGLAGYLVKPVKARELVDAVRRALHGSRGAWG